MAATLQVQGFLVVKENGSLRVTKRKPALEADEIATAITVRVPRDYFRRPPITLTVDLPAPEPEKLGADVGAVIAPEPEAPGHDG